MSPLPRTGRLFVLVVMLSSLASCSDTPLVPDASRAIRRPASADIVDGAHGGNAHFFFVPPMVSRAAIHRGTSDPTLSPQVDVCDIGTTTPNATSQCLAGPIASFSTNGGTGGATVHYDAATEHYAVNWDTDRSSLTLVTGHYYRVSVRVAGTVLGFADLVPVSGGSELKNYRTGDIIALLNGRTLPIKFRIEQGAVAVISEEHGGTATLADGGVTVAFPPGAVEGDIGVTATPLPTGADGTDTSVLPGTRFEFQPSPTQFSVPVQLTLALPATLPTGIRTERLAVCKMIEGACRPIRGSQVDLNARTVTAQITSFSEYGITEWPEILRWVFDESTWSGAGTPVAGWLTTQAGEIVVIPNGANGPGDVAEWSPDGSRVAYAALGDGGMENIRVVNADGTGNTVVATGHRTRFAKWSPNGQKLLFLGWEDGVCQSEGCVLMVMNATGTAVTPVAYVDEWYNAAAWSPDGQQIAFANTSWEGVGCLCVVNADGTGQHAIVTGVQGIGDIYGVSGISWSPDGQRIAFEGRIGPEASTMGVFVVNRDGTNLHVVASGDVRGVAWSPSGEDLIVFTRTTTDEVTGGIYVVGGDGTGERLLAAGADVPSWSPDGRRIAFSGGGVWIVNVDGTGLQPLESPGGLQHADPFWRP